MILGSPAQASPLLASLTLPGRALQPQLDLKHFPLLRVNGSSALSLFPNFNTMDPVQKAVINHTFGVPPPLKKKPIISCNICHLRFNSTNQAEAHYKGHKHARKLKAIDAMKNKQRNQDREKEREKKREAEEAKTEAKTEATPALMDASLVDGSSPSGKPKTEEGQGSSVMLTPVSETSSPDASASEGTAAAEPAGEQREAAKAESDGTAAAAEEEEGEKDPKKSSKQHLYCPVCKVTVNSASQLEAHYSGSKHKLMLEGHSVQPRRRGKVVSSRLAARTKRHGSKNVPASASQTFQCEVCEISVNSETQLKQHMSSRRHKDRLAGKPPKPKFSPYTKSQTHSVLANLRWNGVTGGAASVLGGGCYPCTINAITPQTKLALQKQLSKTLAAGFLPSPLAPAALCTMATNTLTLRHAPIIQAPLLSPALFRPAPGPLRATHAPIIFSPY